MIRHEPISLAMLVPQADGKFGVQVLYPDANNMHTPYQPKKPPAKKSAFDQVGTNAAVANLRKLTATEGTPQQVQQAKPPLNSFRQPSHPVSLGPSIVLVKKPAPTAQEAPKPVQKAATAAQSAAFPLILGPSEQQQLLDILNSGQLTTLKRQATKLDSLINKEVNARKQDAEMAIIHSDPITDPNGKLFTYYTYLARTLTSAWQACHTLSSTMVDGAESMTCAVLDKAGAACPLIQPATEVLKFFVGLYDAREGTKFVQRIAHRFPTLQAAFAELEPLARKLTLEQKEKILQLEDGHGLKDAIYKAQAFITADDICGSAITRQANEDCQAVLEAIKESDKAPGKPTIDEMVFAVTGRMPAPSLTPRPSLALAGNGHNSAIAQRLQEQEHQIATLSEQVMKLQDRSQQQPQEGCCILV